MPWSVAAAAVAAGGAIYSSNKSSKAGSKSTTQDPAYLRGAKEELVQRGTDLSHRTQETYGGDRIAPMSGNEQSAYDKAAAGSPQARGYFRQAGDQLDASASEFNTENLQKYMNPYTDAVLQPQIREQNKQYAQDKASLANSKAGAWGGDRSAIAESQLEKNHMQNVSDLTGKTFAGAFDDATKNFFNDASRHQQAATSYQRLGEGVENLDTQDIQNLMATGGTKRLLQQAGLDVDYQKFLETRDWDVNNLDTLIQAISAAGGNTTTTRTDSTAKAGLPGQILGAGVSLAGMYFNGNRGGTFTNSNGQVKPNVSDGTAMSDAANRSYFNPATTMDA